MKFKFSVECEFGDTVTTDATLIISTNELGGLGIKESDLQFNLQMSFWDDDFQNIMATESQQSLNKKTNIQVSFNESRHWVDKRPCRFSKWH